MEFTIKHKEKRVYEVIMPDGKTFDFTDAEAAAAEFVEFFNSKSNEYYNQFNKYDSYQEFIRGISMTISDSMDDYVSYKHRDKMDIWVNFVSRSDSREEIEKAEEFYGEALRSGYLYCTIENEVGDDFNDVAVWDAPEEVAELFFPAEVEDKGGNSEMYQAFYDEIVRCNNRVTNYYNIPNHVMRDWGIRRKVVENHWYQQDWYNPMERAVENFFDNEGRTLEEARDNIIIEFVKQIRDIERDENGIRCIY